METIIAFPFGKDIINEVAIQCNVSISTKYYS